MYPRVSQRNPSAPQPVQTPAAPAQPQLSPELLAYREGLTVLPQSLTAPQTARRLTADSVASYLKALILPSALDYGRHTRLHADFLSEVVDRFNECMLDWTPHQTISVHRARLLATVYILFHREAFTSTGYLDVAECKAFLRKHLRDWPEALANIEQGLPDALLDDIRLASTTATTRFVHFPELEKPDPVELPLPPEAAVPDDPGVDLEEEREKEREHGARSGYQQGSARRTPRPAPPAVPLLPETMELPALSTLPTQPRELSKQFDLATLQAILRAAYQQRHLGLFEAVLRTNIDPNHVHGDGQTLLHHVCRDGEMHYLIPLLKALRVADKCNGSYIEHALTPSSTPAPRAAVKAPAVRRLTLPLPFLGRSAASSSPLSISAPTVVPPSTLRPPRRIDHPDRPDGNTALYLAVQQQRDEVIRHLLSDRDEPDRNYFGYRPNLHQLNRAGFSPLRLAIQNGWEAIAQLLREADPIRHDEALTYAIRNGQLDAVVQLCELGADPEHAPDNDRSALHTACARNQLEVVRLLLERGVRQNAQLDSGRTPLHHAAILGYVEIVKLLLEHGADTHARTPAGKTALDLARDKGHTTVVALLEQAGAVIPATQAAVPAPAWAESIRAALPATSGQSQAAVHALYEAVLNSDTAEAEAILQQCTARRLNLRDILNQDILTQRTASFGWTVFQLACQQGCDIIVKAMLTHQADPALANHLGQRPIHIVSAAGDGPGHLATLKQLLPTTPADAVYAANLPTPEGLRPLHLAAARGHTQLVRCLLAAGVQDHATPAGQTALHLACAHGHRETVQTLLERLSSEQRHVCLNTPDPQGNTALHYAAEGGHLRMVEDLLALGADRTRLNRHGATPELLAARAGYQWIALRLSEPGQNPLQQAVLNYDRNTDLAAIARLLEKTQGNQADALDHGWQLTQWASLYGKTDLLEELAQLNPANINPVKDGKSLLHEVCANGLHEIAEWIVLRLSDASVRQAAIQATQPKDGHTPLHLASLHGHLGIVRLLMKHGANLNARATQGGTPLLLATGMGHAAVVQALLESPQTDRNLADKKGNTPLHLTAANGQSLITFTLLRNTAGNTAPADPTLVNAQRHTAYAVAVRHGHTEVAERLRLAMADALCVACGPEGSRSQVEHLVQLGVDPNQLNTTGTTALHVAALAGQVPVVKLLLDKGAARDGLDRKKKTALQTLAEIKTQSALQQRIVQILQGHADPGPRDITQTSLVALIEACETGDLTAVEACLRADKRKIKAYLGSRYPYGKEALRIAIRHGYANITEYLLKQGANPRQIIDGKAIFHIASELGHVSVIDLLLQQGVPIDEKDSLGWTALHIASQNGHVAVVAHLLNNGGDVNNEIIDAKTARYASSKRAFNSTNPIKRKAWENKYYKYGTTALHVAAQHGHKAVLICLLDNGATVDKFNKDGLTPLYIASQYDHEAIVACLIEKGAAVGKMNANGRTALDVAAEKGHDSVVACFLEKSTTAEVESALNIACKFGHESIVARLLEKSTAAEVESALNTACKYGRESIVARLLEKWPVVNNGNTTALHVASKYGHEAVAALLLKKGAMIEKEIVDEITHRRYDYDSNVEYTTTTYGATHGWTPLYLATYHGHDTLIPLLISNGVGANKVYGDGKTVLHVASEKGHVTVVARLLENGARVNKKIIAAIQHYIWQVRLEMNL